MSINYVETGFKRKQKHDVEAIFHVKPGTNLTPIRSKTIYGKVGSQNKLPNWI